MGRDGRNTYYVLKEACQEAARRGVVLEAEFEEGEMVLVERRDIMVVGNCGEVDEVEEDVLMEVGLLYSVSIGHLISLLKFVVTYDPAETSKLDVDPLAV